MDKILGLLKPQETPYGVLATYHEISITNIDWIKRVAYVELSSYVNRDAKNNSAISLGSIGFNFTDAEKFPFSPESDTIQDAYRGIILTFPEWNNAEVIITDSTYAVGNDNTETE